MMRWQSRTNNVPAITWIPTLTADKVTSILPVDSIARTLQVLILSTPTTIGPPAVEVAVVGTDRVLSGLTLLQDLSLIEVALVQEVKWSGDDTRDCCQGKKEGLERNHGWIIGCWWLYVLKQRVFDRLRSEGGMLDNE